MLALLQHPNINPVLFDVPGTPLALRWYGLMYVLAFVFGYFALRWLQKTGYLRVKAEDITNIIVYGVLGVFIGGRLGYLLFYQFDRLFLGTDELSTGERLRMIFAVWEGGMSFHGGVLGVSAAVLIYTWRHKQGFWNIHDAAVHFVPLGVALVRIGNFINGELFGRVITDDAGKPIYDAEKLPWYAMKFPTDSDPDARLALQFAQKQDYAATHGVKLSEVPPEALQPLPVNPEVWDKVEQYFPGRYPSQIVQFVFEGMLVLLLLWLLRRKLKYPGQLAAAFLMLYAVFRIPAEIIRQPDTQIDPSHADELGGTAVFLNAIGLTMGQFLSVCIFVGGLFLFVLFQLKRVGGAEYTKDERRAGFWRDTLRDFPEIIGLRKKSTASSKDAADPKREDAGA